ncbi:MAG: globin domain-containing protein [Janthinobacterium lividum]
MTEAQKQLVHSTLPSLHQHGDAIAQLFYERMFEAHPDIREMFSGDDQQSGAQAKRLAGYIISYAGHLDRLDLLGPAMTNVSRRHVSINVQADQYPVVGQYLLAAIASVLGESATPDMLEAWAVAYDELAGAMIDHEKQMYTAA